MKKVTSLETNKRWRDLIREKLNWEPIYPLKEGIKLTYEWINNKINDDIKINEDIAYSYLNNIH